MLSDVEEFCIYTYDDSGLEQEFVITNIDEFLKSQEDVLRLVEELENKVAFQRDLKIGIECHFIKCNDKVTGEDLSEREVLYLSQAVYHNMRTIRRAREFLGLDPEPQIADSKIKTDFLKSKSHLN